jgi:DNA-nicking Smr family endonuclease
MSNNDDDRIFREAMRGVRRLRRGADRPIAPRPRAVASFARAETSAVLRESLDRPADAALLESAEELEFSRPGTTREALRRLRRGRYAVQAEVDLHGLSREAAHDALCDFVASCAARGLRCVRVIHGKGRRSGTRGPVIKRVVDHGLRRMQSVIAFASARPVDGGTGAVYVLLAPHARHGRG